MYRTPPPTPISRKKSPKKRGNLFRISRYLFVRGIVLLATITVTVFLIIIIANWGGYMDDVVRSNIQLMIFSQTRSGWLDDVPQEERQEIIDQTVQAMEEAAGLNQPFLLRTLRWVGKGMTFDWGKTDLQPSTSNYGVRGALQPIGKVILQSLPRTLLLFGTAYLCLFFVSVFLALPLTKLHGSWLDKIVIALSPLASAPAWIYGVILNLLALKLMGTSLSSRGADIQNLAQQGRFFLILQRMYLPFLAIFVSGIFQGIYAWRTLFMLYGQEDYVEVARAKGVPKGLLNRRYMLRPLLPNLVTSFILLFITLWQESIALEYIFLVPGIGRLFLNSIRTVPPSNEVMVSIVVTFAYLLAITVFMLDLIYALVDPRVRIDASQKTQTKRKSSLMAWIKDLFSRPKNRPVLAGKEHKTSTSNRLKGWLKAIREGFQNIQFSWKELVRHPAAMMGLGIILIMLILSGYTVIRYDYNDMIVNWRGVNDAWQRNPEMAPPAWTNAFRKDKLPETLILHSADASRDPSSAITKTREAVSEDMTQIVIQMPFRYEYQTYPQDMGVFLDIRYDEKLPLIIYTWLTPDGREIKLTSFTVNTSSDVFYFSQSEDLQRMLATQNPHQALLSDPETGFKTPLPGDYVLQIKAYVFDETADIDADFVLYGQVYGWAGTDGKGRDLAIPLLWGMPIALIFGILAAAGTSFFSMFLAALGSWFGGWMDGVIQRLTEINMILPFLPVSIMIFVMYSKSILVILAVTVLLNIFGNSIKSYRSLFLQIKEEAYIEATRAYGASHGRIILRYMIPRIIPLLIPRLVLLVPGYVFLETTLALFDVSDPVLPTWGKLLIEGFEVGIYRGSYHLVLEPLFFLFLVGSAFVLLGVSLEYIFQPRLRER